MAKTLKIGGTVLANLPTPDERTAATEEISIFEKTLGASLEESPSSKGSTEDFILKKIQQK